MGISPASDCGKPQSDAGEVLKRIHTRFKTRRKFEIKNEDMGKLQKDLDRLGEWAVENAMKVNPSKSKAIRFTRARVKDPLNYSLMDTLIPQASSCKYLGIILRSDLS